MSDELDALNQRLARLEQSVGEFGRIAAALKNLEVAPESGGGRIDLSRGNAVLHIDGLLKTGKGDYTPVPAQLAAEPAPVQQQTTLLTQVIMGGGGSAGAGLQARVEALEKALEGATLTIVCNGDGTMTGTLTWGT